MVFRTYPAEKYHLPNIQRRWMEAGQREALLSVYQQNGMPGDYQSSEKAGEEQTWWKHMRLGRQWAGRAGSWEGHSSGEKRIWDREWAGRGKYGQAAILF